MSGTDLLGADELAWFDSQELLEQFRILDYSKRPGIGFVSAVREIHRESAQITTRQLGKVLMFRTKRRDPVDPLVLPAVDASP